MSYLVFYFLFYYYYLKFEVIELPLNNYVSKKIKNFFFGAKKYLSNFYTH